MTKFICDVSYVHSDIPTRIVASTNNEMLANFNFTLTDQSVSDESGFGIKDIPVCESEKYPIISNGQRFKKDSRKWLHKSTDKKNMKCDDFSSIIESSMKAVDTTEASDSCNGTDYRQNVYVLKTFLQTEENEAKSTIKGCITNIKNIEENANGPEMFRRKNKRRLISPSAGNQFNVRYDDSMENKLRNFIVLSHSFKPIKSDNINNQNFKETSGDATSNVSPWQIISSDFSGPNTISNLAWNSEDSNIWRKSRIVPSDGSTTPTASESPPNSPIPLKRSKTHHMATEDTTSSRLVWDNTPTDSILDYSDTPCGSPWVSLSLEDSLLNSCTVRTTQKNCSNSSENCN